MTTRENAYGALIFYILMLDVMEKERNKKRQADGKLAKEEKRRKWEAKQSRKHQAEEKLKSINSWIQDHLHFASLVSEEEIDTIRLSATNKAPTIGNFLAPYFDVQNKKEGMITSSGERLFIAEGTETVRILIQQSALPTRYGLEQIQVKSVFVKPSVLFEPPVNLLKDIYMAMTKEDDKEEKKSSPKFRLLVGSEAVQSKVAGFHVVRGALACGVVPADRTIEWLDNFLLTMKKEGTKKIRLLALDGVCDTSNLGSMIRCASAFGVHAIVVSKDTCDAWYRRTIRVSMGHVFKVPVIRAENLAAEVRKWSGDEFRISSYGAVLDTDNLLSDLKTGQVSSWCLVLGNEGNGISPAVANACTQRIRIDMVSGVDSLSVPVACGILMHGLREREHA